MAVLLYVLGVTGTVAVLLLLGYVGVCVLRQSAADPLAALGVKASYSGNTLPRARIDAYLEYKEQLRGEFASKSVDDKAWMCQLPPQVKEMLKYKLMQRAIGGVQSLQKIDADARSYSRLFAKDMISTSFWNSVMEVEQNVSLELEAIKAEAACVEPAQAEQRCIIQEAMQFVMRYGAGPYGLDNLDAIDDIMKHFPAPGQMGMPSGNAPSGSIPPGSIPPGSIPPGMIPPGMVPSPGMLQGMPPPGMPPFGMPPRGGPSPVQAAPQDADAGDTYKWRQDTDEVEVTVAVPSSVTKNQVKVTFQPRQLRVELAGAVLVEGKLASLCSVDGCTWTLSKDRVVVSMEKAHPRPWPSLFLKA